MEDFRNWLTNIRNRQPILFMGAILVIGLVLVVIVLLILPPTRNTIITLLATPTPTFTPTLAPSPTSTPTPTSTWTPTMTPTPTNTFTPTATSTPTPIRRKIKHNTRLFLTPEKEDFVDRWLYEGTPVAVKGKDDSAEWFLVEVIIAGWIKTDSVDSVPEKDIPDLLVETPPTSPDNSAPDETTTPPDNPTPNETAMKRDEKKWGELQTGEELRIPLDVGDGKPFTVSILFHPSRPTGVSLDVVENGRSKEHMDSESIETPFKGDQGTGALILTGGSEAEYELILKNSDRHDAVDFEYCLMTYSPEGWDCD